MGVNREWRKKRKKEKSLLLISTISQSLWTCHGTELKPWHFPSATLPYLPCCDELHSQTMNQDKPSPKRCFLSNIWPQKSNIKIDTSKWSAHEVLAPRRQTQRELLSMKGQFGTPSKSVSSRQARLHRKILSYKNKWDPRCDKPGRVVHRLWN